jgi:hypothetical protein
MLYCASPTPNRRDTMKPSMMTEMRVEVTHRIVYTIDLDGINYSENPDDMMELVKDRLIDEYGKHYLKDADISIEYL